VFGSSLGALAGALVAIPVGSAIQVIFREVWNRTRPEPVHTEPALAAGEGPPPELPALAPDNGESPPGVGDHGGEPARVDGGTG
jgi:hypothetical protein